MLKKSSTDPAFSGDTLKALEEQIKELERQLELMTAQKYTYQSTNRDLAQANALMKVTVKQQNDEIDALKEENVKLVKELLQLKTDMLEKVKSTSTSSSSTWKLKN